MASGGPRLAVLLGLCALGLTALAAAATGFPLPGRLPPGERARIEGVVEGALVSTRAAAEPFAMRREVFEYLLDHPDFASHLTRALRLARYRIWREADGLWLDDGWGTRGRFTVVHAEPGLRLMHARGRYEARLLPDIHGQAVVALSYGAGPAGGPSALTTSVAGSVQLDSAVLTALGRVGGPLVQAKADREARKLLKVFVRVARALAEHPAEVIQRLAEQPEVPRRELGEFRRLLALD